MVSYQERWEQAMQKEKDSSTKVEHLRLEEYKKHPRFSCAYCDKTHSHLKCIYLADKTTEESKQTTEHYYNNADYSWYE